MYIKDIIILLLVISVTHINSCNPQNNKTSGIASSSFTDEKTSTVILSSNFKVRVVLKCETKF